MERLYYTAAEIAEMVGVGRTKSYGLIKKMNKELEKDGFLVIDGKIPKEYFDARYFGGSRAKEVSA
ncbi:MAG: ICEBs1 excisionase [Eubacteriales bacterium]|nr:ICEBs1 excisionase [Eubacteriales bacterium]